MGRFIADQDHDDGNQIVEFPPAKRCFDDRQETTCTHGVDPSHIENIGQFRQLLKG